MSIVWFVSCCTRRLPVSLKMKAAMYSSVLLSLFALSYAQQRVAPGVPPQQYQQVPQQQYQAPQQVHHQVPVQNMQQQHVPHHGQPQVQQHGQAHGHHPQGQILNAANIAQEKQHIQDHMEVPIDTSKMTDQELQFHYFKMHDADNNNKLDGCELIKSLIHWHEQDAGGHSHDEAHAPPKSHSDSELGEMVDPILHEMDKNEDGFIEWHEYKSANH